MKRSTPFHREIELWEEENPTGGKVYSYDNYFYAPVRGYPHCSANDVKMYGSCGGWGSFGDGFPLSTKFDMSKMDKGTSITCDETPGIIEAAADILVSVGGEVVEAVADKTMETGKNIFSNLKAKIFNSPTYSMGLALACSFLTLFVTKRIGLSFFVLIKIEVVVLIIKIIVIRAIIIIIILLVNIIMLLIKIIILIINSLFIFKWCLIINNLHT
ncbi:hypothetical protein Wxf_00014 [Armadillidium vulgare]|nr:hypothetical protein Wxf_00014 [Armadillidium vulgare] [Wolbachia endosymbiont of Armadillidium vulgare]